MKIVIDIGNEMFEAIKIGQYYGTKSDLERLIAEGKPIEDGRPTLIYKGQVVYLTDEHIQAMAELEKEQMKKEVVEQLKKTIDGLSDFDLEFEPNDTKTHFPKVLDGTVYQDSFCPYAHNCIEYFGSHCADRCPLKKESEE